MELIPDHSKGAYQIHSYDPGKLVINSVAYTQSIVVSLDNIVPWSPASFSALKREDFQVLLDQKPQIILLGTGIKQIFPPPELLNLLAEKNIGIEVMSTAAACRTFNVLAAEGRQVVAGLLIR